LACRGFTERENVPSAAIEATILDWGVEIDPLGIYDAGWGQWRNHVNLVMPNFLNVDSDFTLGLSVSAFFFYGGSFDLSWSPAEFWRRLFEGNRC